MLPAWVKENLDGMFPEELERHADRLKQYWNQVPCEPQETAVITALRDYCYWKVEAMRCRRVGLIGKALEYERICDHIYRKSIPKDYQW